jgi:hypothetical protein
VVGAWNKQEVRGVPQWITDQLHDVYVMAAMFIVPGGEAAFLGSSQRRH